MTRYGLFLEYFIYIPNCHDLDIYLLDNMRRVVYYGDGILWINSSKKFRLSKASLYSRGFIIKGAVVVVVDCIISAQNFNKSFVIFLD